MHSNNRVDIPEVMAGDICAVVGLKNTTTGDTLCDEKAPVILEPMVFPEPVIQIAIEPKNQTRSRKDDYGTFKIGRRRPNFPYFY